MVRGSKLHSVVSDTVPFYTNKVTSGSECKWITSQSLQVMFLLKAFLFDMEIADTGSKNQ